MTCPDCGKRHTPEQGCLSGVLLVCGGRTLGLPTPSKLAPEPHAERWAAKHCLGQMAARMIITAVRHGAARGADELAGEWARECALPEEPMPADWNAHGRGAGHRRNAAMLAREPRPVACVAFPGGRGTADMVKRCKAAGVPVWEIEP